jgi:hypothetical protein
MIRGVDVAEFLEREEAGAMGRILEAVGGGLVDRHRPRAGARRGLLAGVHLKGFETVSRFITRTGILRISNAIRHGSTLSSLREEKRFLRRGTARGENRRGLK